MDETKSPQTKNTGSITGEIRNRNPLLVSYNDELDRPATAD
ncbi:MAG: hypothetical protein ACXWM6_14710 [Thermodesulfobacteriota bacterium]